MKSTKYYLPIIFLSVVFFIPDAISQHKFEFGVGTDPIIVPINLGTYVESGPGFYDINGRGKITTAVSAYFNYWPFKHVGFSIGETARSFKSLIDFSIPDPFNKNLEPIIERSYPFSAKGLGPSVGILFRMEKWRARIGVGIFELFDQKYTPSSSISGVTIFESGGDVLADIQVDEEAYWRAIPYSYKLLQFETQYNIVDNLCIKLSFETTGRSRYPDPYTVRISGFTPQTAPQIRVLNDYEMRSTLTSFSLGVCYTIGFGHYKYNELNSSE